MIRKAAIYARVAVAQLAACRSHNPKVVSSILTCHIGMASMHSQLGMEKLESSLAYAYRIHACFLLGHLSIFRQASHLELGTHFEEQRRQSVLASGICWHSGRFQSADVAFSKSKVKVSRVHVSRDAAHVGECNLQL